MDAESVYIMKKEEPTGAEDAEQNMFPNQRLRIQAENRPRPKKSEILARREKVKRFVARGIDNVAISKVLKVSEGIIRKDKLAIIKDIEQETRKTPIKDLMLQTVLQGKEVIREAWNKYHNKETSEGTKMHALRIVLDAVEKQARIYVNLGLIKDKSGNPLRPGPETQLSVTNILLEIQEDAKREIKVVDIEKKSEKDNKK